MRMVTCVYLVLVCDWLFVLPHQDLSASLLENNYVKLCLMFVPHFDRNKMAGISTTGDHFAVDFYSTCNYLFIFHWVIFKTFIPLTPKYI